MQRFIPDEAFPSYNNMFRWVKNTGTRLVLLRNVVNKAYNKYKPLKSMFLI